MELSDFFGKYYAGTSFWVKVMKFREKERLRNEVMIWNFLHVRVTACAYV